MRRFQIKDTIAYVNIVKIHISSECMQKFEPFIHAILNLLFLHVKSLTLEGTFALKKKKAWQNFMLGPPFFAGKMTQLLLQYALSHVVHQNLMLLVLRPSKRHCHKLPKFHSSP